VSWWQAQHEPYKRVLERAREKITLELLTEAMTKIPQRVREELAQGPLPHRYDCRICKAVLAHASHMERDANFGTIDLDDPLAIVWLYHEVPKLDVKERDEQWWGPPADAQHQRCVETYRLAGWVAR
jgi:hypothetical protein